MKGLEGLADIKSYKNYKIVCKSGCQSQVVGGKVYEENTVVNKMS